MNAARVCKLRNGVIFYYYFRCCFSRGQNALLGTGINALLGTRINALLGTSIKALLGTSILKVSKQ
jgi:hypothetical protein